MLLQELREFVEAIEVVRLPLIAHLVAWVLKAIELDGAATQHKARLRLLREPVARLSDLKDAVDESADVLVLTPEQYRPPMLREREPTEQVGLPAAGLTAVEQVVG